MPSTSPRNIQEEEEEEANVVDENSSLVIVVMGTTISSKRKPRCRSIRLLPIVLNHQKVVIMAVFTILFSLAIFLIVSSEICFGRIPLFSSFHQTRQSSHQDIIRFADLLPKDLDHLSHYYLENVQDDQSQNHHNILLGALGVQLLLFGGWENNRDVIGIQGSWKRRSAPPNSDRKGWKLDDRLAFITPSWKGGGPVDYENGIFELALELLEEYDYSNGDETNNNSNNTERKILSVTDLANLLEDQVGLTVDQDFNDTTTQRVLQAMLTWKIPPFIPASPDQQMTSQKKMLFLFSFGAHRSCPSPSDCPQGPGATNELLAATATAYIQELITTTFSTTTNSEVENEIHIVAQWEVATALQQQQQQQQQQRHYNESLFMDIPSEMKVTITSVGTPGSYENTADIFELMLCEWFQNHRDTIRDAIILAHPEHLRRVWWTAKTSVMRHIKQQQQQQQQQQQVLLREITTNDIGGPVCDYYPLTFLEHVRLISAMSPYELDWYSTINSPTTNKAPNIVDLFASLKHPTKVHTTTTTTGKKSSIQTTWYDETYLGFFPDKDNPQMWTQDRRIWILYDHWAVLKGIVSGVIDVDMIFDR